MTMNKRIFNAIAVCLLLAGAAWAQQAVPVSIFVSAQPKHGQEVPAIYPEDVMVFQGDQRMRVTEWAPLQGEQAGLELFLLIDDAIDSSLGLQFKDLREFIQEQPSTTRIALGYIRFGSVHVVQELTTDHAAVANGLRLPIGSGTMASPYIALKNLMEDWPETTGRRHIFLISSGFDALQPGPTNTYLENAIEQAQRMGIQIYSIYAGQFAHAGDAYWGFRWGQDNLLQLADETGGDVYWQGLHMPLSFGPYLDRFADRLKHQYKLTFLARSHKKPGLERIRLETEVPHVELVAAEKVYVPAAR